MKLRAASLLLVCSAFLFSFEKKDSRVTVNELKIKAPFDVVTIKVPDFSNCTKLSITDFGAVRGDKSKTTEAIASAIDKAHELGGGIVIIPEGEWLTKQIHFKSDVNLHLNKGAVKDFNEWRAKQLGYVYFSRFKDLIINE